MSDDLNRLLKIVALEDERRSAIMMDARLRLAFRERRAAASRGSRWFGYSLAAALLAGLSLQIVWTTRHLTIREGAAGGVSREVTTAYLPLTYGAVPMTDGRVIRIEVPRTSLRVFGLLPVDDSDTEAGNILADVVVGEDGLARAVRFVRPMKTKSD